MEKDRNHPTARIQPGDAAPEETHKQTCPQMNPLAVLTVEIGEKIVGVYRLVSPIAMKKHSGLVP